MGPGDDKVSAATDLLNVKLLHDNGEEVCRIIRLCDRFDRLPILFYTGVIPSDEFADMVARSGAQGVVDKTSGGKLLVTKVNRLLEQGGPPWPALSNS